MADDPLFKFLQSVTEKIKVEKEHKALMEKLEEKDAESKEDPLLSAINILKQKIVEVKQPALSGNSLNQPEATKEASPSVAENTEEKDNFGDFLSKLKDIISDNKPKDASKEASLDVALPVVQEQETTKAETTETKSDTDSIKNDYVEVLDKLSNEVATEKEPQKISEIKKLIEQYAEKYFKKAAVMSEYAGGGGTNAVQYANGGTMNGDLNVNGNYLSGGVNLLDIFSGGGGGGGDPAVNTAVYAGSASWNSNFTTTNYFSSFWNAAVDELFNFYVTQTDPGSAFISEDGNYYIIANSKLDNVDLWNSAYTQTFLLSSQWSSVYVTVLGLSARWESVYTTFNQNSAKYESTYSSVASNSGSWSSVYNTYNALSASYASETLAIAYAVAL